MSQDSQPMRFYVLRVLSGQEKKVCEYIEAAKSNGTLGSYVRRVLVPTEQVVSQRNGKKVVKERPYMPGYVLVEAALVGDTEHTLCTIPNVIGFLNSRMTDGQLSPEPLRTQEVQDLLGQADRDAEGAGRFDVEYSVGESVRIIDGPFSDFSATIDEVKSDKRKIKVMVKIFGRKTPLELDYTQVEKE